MLQNERAHGYKDSRLFLSRSLALLVARIRRRLLDVGLDHFGQVGPVSGRHEGIVLSNVVQDVKIMRVRHPLIYSSSILAEP